MMKHFVISCVCMGLMAMPVFGQVKLSERLEKIASHLGNGGAHFSVTDGEGDLEAFLQMLDGFLKIADEQLPVDVSLQQLGQDLGAYEILGSGASSAKKKNHWHNRNFILTTGKHEGILSLLGQKAVKPLAASFAPAGADIVLEAELDLRQVEKTAKKVAASFGKMAEAEVAGAFGEEVSEGVTVGSLLSSLSVRASLVAWFDEKQKAEVMPGLEFPTPHLVIRVDRAAPLWKILAVELKEDSDVVEKDGDVYYRAEGEASPFGLMQPQLIWNEKKGQLWFTFSEDSLKLCRGDGPKLAGNEGYLAATAGLSSTTNVNGYISAQALTLLEQVAGIAKLANEEAAIVASLFETLLSNTKSPDGYAMALSLLKDGILSLSNAPFPNKGGSSAGPAQVAGIAVLAGLATPAILKAKKNADKAKEINNMRQLLMALSEYEAEFGKYPAKLQLLEEKKMLDEGVLDILVAPDLEYRGEEVGGSDTAKSDSIILYLRIPDLGKVVFGRADGSVREEREARFDELLEKQKK